MQNVNTPTEGKNSDKIEAESALCGADCSALTIARLIPHPWRQGKIRNVYEFPITRKIIIEADQNIHADEILAMAKRCHYKEIGLEIMGDGYQISLSPPSV